MKTIKIMNIKKINYDNYVYNLELESASEVDDLFWIEQNTGIVTHNCLPKDITALATWAKEELGYEPELLWEVLQSNKRIGQHRRTQRG
jgi:hypothetical protein